jgi:hypothetical protein
MTCIALFKRNFDLLGAMVILFFCCIIGAGCFYDDFLRVFSAMYDIVWNG